MIPHNITIEVCKKYAIGKLQDALIAQGIPVDGITSHSAQGLLEVRLADSATQQQKDSIDGLFATWASEQDTESTSAAPMVTYAESHKELKKKFLFALYQFEVAGINAHVTPGANLVADYQAVFTAAMAVVNTLPPQYIDNLNKQRDLDGVAVPIAQLNTLPLCRQFSATLRGWLNTRVAMANNADLILET